jgi:hypothetical protein
LLTKCSNLAYEMFKSCLRNVQILSAKIKIISESCKSFNGFFKDIWFHIVAEYVIGRVSDI